MSAGPNQESSPSCGGREDGLFDNFPGLDIEKDLAEDTSVTEDSCGKEFTSSNMDVNLEPYVGKEFKSEQAAREFYNAYARYMGFSIRKGAIYRSARQQAVTSRIFVCSKEGFRPESSDVNEKGNIKRRMAITRVGCKAQLWVKRQPSGMWVVKQFQREHNHELTPMKVHILRSHKNIFRNLKEYVETLKGAGVDASQIQRLLLEEARGMGNLGARDNNAESDDKRKIKELSAELRRERRRSATYREQLQMVLKHMEDHAHHLSKQIEDIVNNMKEVEHQGS